MPLRLPSTRVLQKTNKEKEKEKKERKRKEKETITFTHCADEGFFTEERKRRFCVVYPH